MPVRLLRPYLGQNVGTVYSGPNDDILRATGTADDNLEGASNYVASSNAAFRAYASSFTTSQGAGSTIAALSDPFKGQGRGVTSYATTGAVPDQLALTTSAANVGKVVVGNTPAVAGTSYSISIIATSGDGLTSTPAVTLVFKAVPFSYSAGSPGYAGSGDSTPANALLSIISGGALTSATSGLILTSAR